MLYSALRILGGVQENWVPDDSAPKPKKNSVTPANTLTRFSKENQPAHKPGRLKKSVLYAGQIRDLEDGIADKLPAIAHEMLRIAFGDMTEHLINHKTGEVVEVPVNPATRLKAQVYLIDRIAGKAEQNKIHELGENANGALKVMLGAAAVSYWARVQGVEGGLPEPEAVDGEVRQLEPGE